MTNPKFLITSASGKTGAAVAIKLLEKGFQVRAFVHRIDARSEVLQNKGAEIYVGSLDDITDVRNSMQDIQRAYFCAPFTANALQIGAQFAIAAQEQKLEFICVMSQWLSDPSNPSIHTRNTWLTDKIFSWMSEVDYAILNPGFFADNYLAAIEPIIDFGIMAMPLGDGLNAPPSTEDIAAVVVGILSNPDSHIGKTFRPTGPKLLTPDEIAASFGKVLGRKVKYLDSPMWMLNKVAKALKLSPFQMEQLRWYMKEYQNNSFAKHAPNNTVSDIAEKDPDDFETIVRRRISVDANFIDRRFIAKILTGVTLTKAMIMPGYNLKKYVKLHEFPVLKNILFAYESHEWKSAH